MLFKRLTLFLFIAVSGFDSPVFSQVPFFRQVPLQSAGINFRVNAICQDSSRFIWLATNEGLYRDDGINFNRVQLPENMSGKNVSTIAALPGRGIIGAIEGWGLFYIAGDSVRTFKLKALDSNTQVSQILPVGQDTYWVATTGKGIVRLTNGSEESFTVDEGLGDNYVYTLFIDERNTIWVGSDGGLSFADLNSGNPRFSNLTTLKGLPDNIIRHVARGPGTTIGIGMEEKGFCLYDVVAGTFQFNKAFDNWQYGPVTSVVKLENEFWIGTKNSGIIDFEFQGENRTRQFSGESGFTGTQVSSMLMDHEGNIWIGAGGELYLSPGEKIEFKRRIHDFELKNIRSLLIDSHQNLWFSNDSNVFCYPVSTGITDPGGNNFRTIIGHHPNVISLYEDRYGFIWMGTFDHGVIRYDPVSGKMRTFSESSGLVNANVLSIDGDSDEIWFATLGGVSRCTLTDSLFDGDVRFENYSEQDGLGNNFIYKVFIDSRHRVWFGTDGKGITCYDKGKFKNYSEQEGLKSKVIYSITEDEHGSIWLSSSHEGIYRFDGRSFRNLDLEKGLSDLNITSVIADGKGNIIAVNRKGIDVINPVTYEVISFGAEMGIYKIDPDVNVTGRDRNGNVWIGTNSGIIRLNLKAESAGIKPVLVLNKVLCFLEPIDTAKYHRFSHDRNHISFDFTAFWYTDPAKISYQYKLDGYNREWITTRDRFVTFPNLTPGSYRFLVRSSINNSFNTSPVVSYSFVIEAPFWEQTWFVSVALLITGLVFYFFIRYRVERLRANERIKKEKIESQYEILKNQVNPHFLFNSFNTLITVIEDDKDIAIEYVNKLSDFFRCMLSYREKDLITIGEELELVETYIFLQQKRYGTNFTVQIDIPGEQRKSWLIPPLALQILIENCLKHNAVSRETKLLVEVYMEENKYLVVKNNINPKFVKEPSTGIGLQNLKNRYQLISNSAIAVSKTDTHFIVKIPLISV